MDFVSNKSTQLQEMLNLIGVKSFEELLVDIPEALRCQKPSVDDGLAELEGLQLMEGIARQNTFSEFDNYLGAGAYEHHVPAIVGSLLSRPEFLTAYTPYQAEVSQGILQASFEFQSSVATLTGMEVSNASVYDGGTACAEALLMCLRLKRERRKVVIAGSLHPHYRQIVDQYLQAHKIEVVTVPFCDDGSLDRERLLQAVNTETAGVLLQSPNFFGVVEELKAIIPEIQERGALTVLSANPLSYGLYASAGELDVDIAVGEMQPFGMPLMFGGPYAGYIACKKSLVRQLPGRIIGETTDLDGKRGFVITLQTREQHIRREKATSNICTNQALMAFASLIAIMWYGREGIPKLALTNFQRASYLRKELNKVKGVTCSLNTPIFNEFIVRFETSVTEIQHQLRLKKIEPGLLLAPYFAEMKNSLLIAVTETKSKEQMDRFVQAVKEVV